MKDCDAERVMVRSGRVVRAWTGRVLLGFGLAITLGAVACRDVAEGPSGGRLAGLSDHIHASMADWDLPGLAVAVVHGDEVIFADGFGVKELGREDPVDAHTLFQIGSVSKSFGAAAIGALVDDGLVDWDDPVVEHLPWFRVKDPEITSEMTIRDLLSHQSGIPGDALPALTIMDARTAAERIRHLDNQTPLRESFRYSNQGYGVAGLVVEAVTGKRWGEWVRERLLHPLEMHNSAASPYELWEDPFVAPTFLGTAPAGTVGIADAPRRNVAMPHGVDREGARRVLAWQSYDSMQAAGSVVSSAAEMANWLRMHLARGRLGDRAVLGAATVEEMHAPQVASGATFLFADDITSSTYALGWHLTTFEGHPYLSHGGGIFGFPAYVALLPGHRRGRCGAGERRRMVPPAPRNHRLGVRPSSRHRAARLARGVHGS